MNKHPSFFSSISFVRISYKTIWLKAWSWYKTDWKMSIKNLREVSEVRLKKNSTPSSSKRRKTISSTIFCATGAWGLSWCVKFFQLINCFRTFNCLFSSIKYRSDVHKGVLIKSLAYIIIVFLRKKNQRIFYKDHGEIDTEKIK